MGVTYLLDTHTLIWWLEGSDKLSKDAKTIISNEESILVSSISALEVATKYRIGKLQKAKSLALNFKQAIKSQNFKELKISISHAQKAGLFELDHKDPFDRILAAQCQIESIPIISIDKELDKFAIRRIW